ncbi:hypothetical protein FACS189499_04580 [Clostridia bacterium]|nr:hypothetical protein FACS189499_04580 [Clostridia bacterium]
MKKFKLLAAILVLAITVSMFPMTVFADSIAKTAKSHPLGKKVSYSLKASPEKLDLKIAVPKDGTLTIGYEFNAEITIFNLYDSDGKQVVPTKNESKTGEYLWTSSTSKIDGARDTFNDGWSTQRSRITWNTTTETAKGDVSYRIDKGTYFLRVVRSNVGLSSLKLGISAVDVSGKSMTSSSTDTASTSSAFTLTQTISVGESIKLGTDSSANASWSTSDKSIATVTGGVVKGVKKGTTAITATANGKTQKIKIIVT